MAENGKFKFLGNRLKELRKQFGKTQDEMGELIGVTKGNISRAEAGKLAEKTMNKYADEYAKVLNITKESKEILNRGLKIAVLDFEILKSVETKFIDDVCEQYSEIYVPSFVYKKLNEMTSSNIAGNIKRDIHFMIKTLDNRKQVIISGPDDCSTDMERKATIDYARNIANDKNTDVNIFTIYPNKEYLKIDRGPIKIIDYRKFKSEVQGFADMELIKKIDSFYSNDIDDYKKKFPNVPNVIVNAHFDKGKTLLTSCVGSNKPDSMIIEKIRWLVNDCGADVNVRSEDNNGFPALTLAIQKNKYDLFSFLLNEMGADPNAGSRKHDNRSNFMQNNEGNMPLMVAAYHSRVKFIKELLHDPRTSVNQQDANGFTALIKAARWGNADTYNLLLSAEGVDKKIVDRDGHDADYWHKHPETIESNANGSRSKPSNKKKFNK